MLNDNIAGSLRPVPLSYSGETEAPRGPDRGARSVGLSSVHIPPSVSSRISSIVSGSSEFAPAGRLRVVSPSVSVARGGSLFSLKGGRVGSDVRRARPALRGVVSGFSRASRRRLMRLMNSIDQRQLSCLPLFVTLTYPSVWSSDPKRWKRDLEVFGKRLERKYPAACCIWRLEFQERGAPHFHLVVFNVRFIDYRWLARAWFDVVGSGDVAHLEAGTEVRRVRSWRGAKAYAAKYVAKKQDLPEGFEYPSGAGRAWGVMGRAQLPVNLRNEKVGFADFFYLRRVLRTHLRKQGIDYRSCGLFSGLTVFLGATAGERLLNYCLSSSS